MIEFRTLGTIDLRDPAGVAVRSVLSQPKRLALFAYLVLERPDDLHRRDTLLGVFWPDLEDERARAILRKSLHYVRRSLGGDVLVGQGDEAVGVRRDWLRCDALEFEQALATGDGARALELYGGDLLAGLFVSGAPEFEQWLERRRWELRDHATTAAWEMAERALEAGNPVGAAHWARRAFGIDSFEETGLRRLLALLDRLGDRAGAILAYEEFARRLAAEGVEPAPETLGLIRDIRARRAPGLVEEAFGPANETGVNPSPATTPPEPELAPAAPRREATRRVVLRAVALSGLLVATSLAIRTLAGGSNGTPPGSGLLREDLPVVLADFASSDERLAWVTTEAFRLDMSRSRVVRLVEPQRVAEALARMERDPNAPLDARAARALAKREGLSAAITGGIHPVGKGYVLSASLLSAADGGVLASHRVVAADSSEILGAIDELSETLRRRIGESATQLRNEPPLEQVTTSNLRALESFSLALRALLAEDATSLGVSLLEEAIELDSTFASAHATLGVVLAATEQQRTRAVDALTKAHRYRHRLPERERLWISAHYYRAVGGSLDRAAHAYESLLELEADRAPRSDLHDLHAEYADLFLSLRDDARAEQFARRAIALNDLGRWMGHFVLGRALAYQGRWDPAEAGVARYLERVANHVWARMLMGQLKASRGEHEAAAAIFERIHQGAKSDPIPHAAAAEHLAALAAVRGRLGLATDQLDGTTAQAETRGIPVRCLRRAVWAARLEAEVAYRPDRARARVEAALTRCPLSRIPRLDRPYLELAELFATAGATARAQRLLDDFEALPDEARVDPDWGGRFAPGNVQRARGALAQAEGRLADAVEAYRTSDAGRCRICAFPGLARAYDRWGRPDSAIAAYERYLRTPEAERLSADFFSLGPTYERLGQLYDAKGDRARAASYLEKFVALWSDADPVLQPRVQRAQRRLEEMSLHASGRRSLAP